MSYDYHVHSNYSDGGFLSSMVEAAEDAGLDGVGFADHCAVSQGATFERARTRFGFNLDLTYERRRRAIEAFREETDLAVFDAVEMDYHPDGEAAIRSFLDGAGFDYALGSIHVLDGRSIQSPGAFADYSPDQRRAAVDRYFDRLVALAESELFEVAAHPDLVERNPALRDVPTGAHYRRAAEAFARSRTVPEVNAGRVLGEYGEFHPHPDFLDALVEAGTAVTVGTDSHRGDEIEPRMDALEAFLREHGIEAVRIYE